MENEGQCLGPVLHTDTPFASEGPPNKHYSDLVHSSFDGYLPFLCLTTPAMRPTHDHARARSTVYGFSNARSLKTAVHVLNMIYEV